MSKINKVSATLDKIYLLATKETEEREFGNLLRIKDNYPKTVLSMDKFYAQDCQGIKRQNIIEFLMEDE